MSLNQIPRFFRIGEHLRSAPRAKAAITKHVLAVPCVHVCVCVCPSLADTRGSPCFRTTRDRGSANDCQHRLTRFFPEGCPKDCPYNNDKSQWPAAGDFEQLTVPNAVNAQLAWPAAFHAREINAGPYGRHLSSCRLSGLTAARCGSSLSSWISR